MKSLEDTHIQLDRQGNLLRWYRLLSRHKFQEGMGIAIGKQFRVESCTLLRVSSQMQRQTYHSLDRGNRPYKVNSRLQTCRLLN